MEKRFEFSIAYIKNVLQSLKSEILNKISKDYFQKIILEDFAEIKSKISQFEVLKMEENIISKVKSTFKKNFALLIGVQ